MTESSYIPIVVKLFIGLLIVAFCYLVRWMARKEREWYEDD